MNKDSYKSNKKVAKIINVNPLLNVSLCLGTPTFKTEVLRLVSNVQLVKKPFIVKKIVNTTLPCYSLIHNKLC